MSESVQLVVIDVQQPISKLLYLNVWPEGRVFLKCKGRKCKMRAFDVGEQPRLNYPFSRVKDLVMFEGFVTGKCIRHMLTSGIPSTRSVERQIVHVS